MKGKDDDLERIKRIESYPTFQDVKKLIQNHLMSAKGA